MVEVEAGRFGWTNFDQIDLISNADGLIWQGGGRQHGVMLNVRPIAGLTIGAGAFTNVGVASAPALARDADGNRVREDPDDPTSPWATVPAGNYAEDGENVRLFFGVAYNHDIVNIRSSFAFRNDHEARWMGSANIRAIDNIPIGVGFDISNLHEFGDIGTSLFQVNAGFNFIDNLSLNFAAALAMSQSDLYDDMYVRCWFWLTYAMGNIVPRLMSTT
jgi:hypothetical protein